MTRIVKCIKLGREAEGLDFAPYPGELGKRTATVGPRGPSIVAGWCRNR